MRVTAIAGLFACGVVFAASGSPVNAEGLDILTVSDKEQKLSKISIIKLAETRTIERETPEPPVETKPTPKVHGVQPNETLSSIASQHHITWNRLFNKNEQVAHPDLIKVGDKLTVPLPEEQLKDRPLPPPPVVVPQPIVQPSNNGQRNASRGTSAPAAPVGRGSSSGNTYTPGYCTWYAKNMRPDLPNNLGNADTWVSRAAAQGLATGSAPRAGAIGQQGMHVVYVQSVNGDGTVTISEMNYNGLYVVSTRTVAASSFTYIY